MIDMQSLLILVKSGDPLVLDDDYIRVDGNVLTISGYDNEKGYTDDLRIEIVKDGFKVANRDPGEETWRNEVLCKTYEEVVTWCYEL